MNLSNHYRSIPAVCARAAVALRGAALALLMGVALPVAAQTAPSKSIQTFLLYYGGGPTLVASDAAKLAKFDLLDFDRFRYNQIGSNTWATIKALNPNVRIYLYVDGPDIYNDQDGQSALNINTISRYDVSRGHPMGSLNGNHPELFLLDSGGNRIYATAFSFPPAGKFDYLMDFGSSVYQSYWVTAIKPDVVDQPWVADGIFTAACVAMPPQVGYSATSVKYPTDTAFSAGMNSFVSAISTGLHGFGQKLWCNKGETRSAIGSAAWRALDASASPPDVFLEEGAFAVMWGPWAVQFTQESEWKNQIDTMAALKNTKAAMLSHTQLVEGQSGSDNFGNTVSFWQILWYSLGSYLLGKNDVLGNAYFMFHGGDSDYNKIIWYNEYDNIDLGKALGSYAVTTIGGVNIYSREFEKGYVYVNPTGNVASVALPQGGRQLTHDNLLSPLTSLPLVSSISLSGHSAAIVLKTTVAPADPNAPSTPAALSASAVSPSQIDLSWTASTDNVGVTGYRVYRAGTLLATLGAVTTYQTTGLAASTSYSYTVQAVDAAGNASAQSASASATTQVAPDAQAPSVPTGLTGTAVSSTQINLTWNASTDNVAVRSYQVYLNDAQIASTTVTSYQHTGLTPGTTYNYRVGAADAVPNYSAWTATPVSVTTPAVADTIAPSTPTGLLASAVSSSQINLSWTAATDNVGVTGYRVYRAGALLVTLGAVTSYQNTGLSPSTSYSYTVQAFDAAGNASAQSNAASATTQSATDTQAPTVPTGLKGKAVSATQINLTWNASTDNVGVVGYYVYLNGVQLATTTTTSFQHTGLTAGTTYNYRVSAHDAVPNHSAWTATPVSVRTSRRRIIGRDFNGDGKSDILWRSNTSGQNAIWIMNGTTLSSNTAIPTVTDLNWSIVGAGDFDGDGKSDILWRNRATGENAIWIMNGSTLSSGGQIPTEADLNRSIAVEAAFVVDGEH